MRNSRPGTNRRPAPATGRQAEKGRGAQSGELRATVGQILLKGERSNRELGRRLHDTVGQSLTLLNMALHRLRKQLPPGANSDLDEAGKITSEIVQQVRDLSRTLGSYMLAELGLADALESYAAALKSRGMNVNIRQKGPERRLPLELEVVLFRIAGEAIEGISRRAGTEEAEISLETGGGEAVLTVTDGSAGFDVAAAGDTGSLGGMRSLAALLGGSLTVESVPGQGTRVIARFPLD